MGGSAYRRGTVGAHIGWKDRGRDEASFAPPTEPNGRISRIRLSSWWLLSKRSAIHAMSLL
jgi:hypothetical protein